MREIFLEYAKRGSMTTEELAGVLNLKPETVRRKAKRGDIPRIPNCRKVLFDPREMILLFCSVPGEGPRSLTIERHKTGVSTIGGYRQCL